MANKRQFPNGTWQYTFKRKGVLEKPLYVTFRDEAEGDEYAARLEALLDRGIVPSEHKRQERILTIAELVREYERDAHPSPKDRSAFGPILRDHGSSPLSAINVDWVDAWIGVGEDGRGRDFSAMLPRLAARPQAWHQASLWPSFYPGFWLVPGLWPGLKSGF